MPVLNIWAHFAINMAYFAGFVNGEYQVGKITILVYKRWA